MSTSLILRHHVIVAARGLSHVRVLRAILLPPELEGRQVVVKVLARCGVVSLHRSGILECDVLAGQKLTVRCVDVF